MKIWFTATTGDSVGVWFGEEEKSELAGRQSPYVFLLCLVHLL